MTTEIIMGGILGLIIAKKGSSVKDISPNSMGTFENSFNNHEFKDITAEKQAGEYHTSRDLNIRLQAIRNPKAWHAHLRL